MHFFFGGGENASYRRMLAERGVESLAVNFAYAKNNLSQALKDGPWNAVVAYCSNVRPAYMEWVRDNLATLDFAIVSQGWDEEWAGIDLAIPLWDGDEPFLFHQMVAQSSSGWVAVSAKAARHNESLLRQADLQGTKLFGLGISSVKLWEQCGFTSVANTDWSLAYQRREAQMLDASGHIRRYRDDRLPMLAEEFGAQASAVLEGTEKALSDAVSGDRDALVSLSVHAWKTLEERWGASRRKGGLRLIVDNAGAPARPPVLDPPTSAPSSEWTQVVSTPLISRGDRKVLPVLAESSRGGALATVNALQLGCDRCVIQQVCDEYKPGHQCAYEIPVEVKTRPQLVALLQSIVELQTRRVMFSSMLEQALGGAPDPATSAEIDRLSNLVKNAADVQSDRFRFTVEASGPGVLSRMFGGQVGQAAQQLPQPVMASQVMSDVVDAELLTDED